MTEINRQPVGLSDLLQVQAGGRNPDDLSQLVRGTLDMYPFYVPDRLRATVEPYATLADGSREFIEVPEGEAWLVEFLSVTVSNSASGTDEYSFSFGLERIIGQGLNGVELISTNLIPAAGGGAGLLVGAAQLARPFMVTAGQRVTLLNCKAAAAADPSGDFSVVYTLLNI